MAIFPAKPFPRNVRPAPSPSQPTVRPVSEPSFQQYAPQPVPMHDTEQMREPLQPENSVPLTPGNYPVPQRDIDAGMQPVFPPAYASNTGAGAQAPMPVNKKAMYEDLKRRKGKQNG